MDKILSKVKNIHLVGIGGVGMSGLALLLKAKGYSVSGSDLSSGYMIKVLREHGITVFLGHRKEQVSKDVQLLGYSSAVNESNPEIQEAMRRRIPILKRGKLLAELCRDKKTIAVAGSHGKTTTTAILGFLLTSLGYEPTVFLGGSSLNYSQGAWWGSEHCLIETDESDGSFLYYNPLVSIITNIDYEHIEYYRTAEALSDSFLDFAVNTKDKVFGWGDQESVSTIIDKTKGIKFGWGDSNHLQGRNFNFDGKHSCFDLFAGGSRIASVKLPLIGEYNCRNALAALAYLWYLDEDLKKASKILEDFRGTRRRFQLSAKVAGVTFIDDYAHHPTEIKAVIKAACLLKPRRLFVVLQPHRYSRVKALFKEFLTCFSDVDKLVVTDIYSASESPLEGITAQELTNQIGKHLPVELSYVPKAELAECIPEGLQDGDLVLSLGAGDINKLMLGVIDEFKKSRVN
ncbi:MAG: UDP-N-acetylmuramate--L-alanine ligase [Candidatus Omnitrophica bacterium]|nr:UDP-N-acetylmuramate--L-alanine ligase [Candidatus Omnitrophota bacterium]